MGATTADTAEREGFGDLATIMGRLAAGDGAALGDLLAAHGAALARSVGGILRSRGVRLPASVVDELVVEAAIEVAELAGSWDPSGAPPWIWARHRIAAGVDRHLGQHADSLDELAGRGRPGAGEGGGIDGRGSAPRPSPAAEVPVVDLVVRLAADHPTLRLLHDAVQQVASPRDQELFYETALQVTLGDRAPAVTVGRLLGMAPAAVRQQHRRVRGRLRALADEDPRYAPLGALPVLADPAA